MKASHIIKTMLCAFCLLSAGMTPVHAEDEAPEPRYVDFDKETISGTVEIEARQLAFIVGGGWGGGVLHYQGKDHPFKITGLKAGGVGYVELDIVGDVYFLDKLEDFSGKYGQASIGATAVKGSVVASIENSKGVILRLKAKSEGVALNLGVGGISIKFED
jgi:hypothetical protein